MASSASYINHICRQGETFDSIAFHYYHEEMYAHYIMQANKDLIPVLIFKGGERLRIPRLTGDTLPKTLPPWRQE